MDAHSLICPSGERVCSICLKPCQCPATQPCGHSFCPSCSNRSWVDELKEKVTCPECRETFLRNKACSYEPLGKMEEATQLTTVDETKQSAQSICAIHKEILNLFCVEDQAPLCSVCRKSWDHSSHTVIPRGEDSFPISKPSNSGIIGYSNAATCIKGNGEVVGGNEKDSTDKLMLIEPQVDFNLEENKEEDTPSNSRVQNSITWILLILFIIQIVGLVTTIFVFTKAKAELPAPCCPSGWIVNQGSCYHVLQLEGSWDDGQRHCSSLGASLAVVADLEKLKVAMQDKGPFDHWVGLLRESGGSWKWTDGTDFNNLFEVEGEGDCAFLSKGVLNRGDCSAEKKWLCSWKAQARGGFHSPAGGRETLRADPVPKDLSTLLPCS
ncbi:uncharacterized protein LOC128408672 [Podarcis raffonei]|uniref:uncharacterized protein LOC128408672 n=1 Tax=Podarcis raffonei TaxID=65483 RepID=UPI0023291790|nr:uncharacterized protein LOC128408672 [Podarcis raffonei]XP_053234638.1 uncharacterized protein LOC128408672 [Podarcis raffonei]